MKRIECSLGLIIILLLPHWGAAQNPITEYEGVSDPHVRVFNDTIYLYTGHDASPTDETWVMRDWRVFSTTDLVDWTLEETISPKDNYMEDNSSDCWASDAATRNGKYYFYFSDRKRGVGVMRSDSPTGPFKDALGEPLVSPMHDPTILIEDDASKTPYLVYGDKEGGGFHIARLNDDMISLAEEPKPITIHGKEWEDAPDWMDKNYLFKKNGTYYLSWGRDYAISENIYGPYECVGAVGQGYNLSEYAHGSFFSWKGQFYHIWCYYLKPGYKFRETIITYCHFDDEGEIVTDVDFLDKHFATGVGQYNAAWPKIEADWFYEKSSDINKQGNRLEGFRLTNIQDGSWVRFNNIHFDGEYNTFVAEVPFASEDGTVEIRTDSLTGELVGKALLAPSNERDKNHTISCDLKSIGDLENLYLVFRGSENFIAELDYLKFVK